MATPRIEEVSDSDSEPIDDPEEMDLDAFDFARPQGTLQPSAGEAAASQIDPETLQQILSTSNQQSSTQVQNAQGMSEQDRVKYAREQQQRSKNWQCLYPIYFDTSRSRQDGRRVRKEEGVKNPLARDLVDALQHIQTTHSTQLEVVFEPTKTHPKDWANPGRVRCNFTSPSKGRVTNKHHLLHLMSSYLKTHPTTEQSPMRLQLQGLPPPKDGKVPVPAVPRGFKMGTVLPLHSPALSGGGVSQNFMKDMMEGMGVAGGQLPPGLEGLANMANMGAGGGGGGKPKQKVMRVKR